jgi:hypothetical protein
MKRSLLTLALLALLHGRNPAEADGPSRAAAAVSARDPTGAVRKVSHEASGAVDSWETP